MTGRGIRASEDERGFTLIELLVVIVVIGILAAIAVPTYLGQQRSARDASVVSDVRNTSVAVDGWLVDHPKLAVTNTADYVAAGGKVVSGTTTVSVTASGTGAYTVCGWAAGGGSYGSASSAFLIDTAARTSGRTTAGCPGEGVASTATPSPSASPSTGTSTGGTAGGTATGGGTTGGTTGTSTPTPTPTPTATASGQWTVCAQEGGTCSFTGTKVVRYGIEPDSYATRRLTDGTPCTNDVFTDPAYGYAKTCSYQQ